MSFKWEPVPCHWPDSRSAVEHNDKIMKTVSLLIGPVEFTSISPLCLNTVLLCLGSHSRFFWIISLVSSVKAHLCLPPSAPLFVDVFSSLTNSKVRCLNALMVAKINILFVKIKAERFL